MFMSLPLTIPVYTVLLCLAWAASCFSCSRIHRCTPPETATHSCSSPARRTSIAACSTARRPAATAGDLPEGARQGTGRSFPHGRRTRPGARAIRGALALAVPCAYWLASSCSRSAWRGGSRCFAAPGLGGRRAGRAVARTPDLAGGRPVPAIAAGSAPARGRRSPGPLPRAGRRGATLYLVNASGKMQSLAQFPAQAGAREIVFPQEEESKRLEGQPGTEMILVLGGTGNEPPAPGEAERLWARAAPSASGLRCRLPSPSACARTASTSKASAARRPG